MNRERLGIMKLTVSMLLFGTIGAFVKQIPLQSSVIALARAVVGMVFLVAVIILKRSRISFSAVKKNLLWLCVSGACLGFNWILLFESYRYTSVAVSTLCYYMAPIIVILVSPFVLKEAITAKKLLCVIAALCGMFCISGVLQSGLPKAGELQGILLGIAAALLYATIILCNKQLKEIGAYEKTVVQLGISAIVMLPYCLVTYVPAEANLTFGPILLLLTIGVVHTGVTYYLYFGSMEYLSGQSVAVISYIDPLVAVLVSVTVLNEPFKLTDSFGALLILGAALISELPVKQKSRDK